VSRFSPPPGFATLQTRIQLSPAAPRIARAYQFLGRDYQAGCRRPVHVSCGTGSGPWPFRATAGWGSGLVPPGRKAKCAAIFELAKRSPDASAVARKNGIEIQPMRQVDIHLSGWKLTSAMGELCIWLDRNHCVPGDLAISKLPNGDLLARVEFSDDAMAEVFEREFAR